MPSDNHDAKLLASLHRRPELKCRVGARAVVIVDRDLARVDVGEPQVIQEVWGHASTHNFPQGCAER